MYPRHSGILYDADFFIIFLNNKSIEFSGQGKLVEKPPCFFKKEAAELVSAASLMLHFVFMLLIYSYKRSNGVGIETFAFRMHEVELDKRLF